MTRRPHVLTGIVAGALGAVVLFAGGGADGRQRTAAADTDTVSALSSFHERVESYATLHRRLAAPQVSSEGHDQLSRLLTARYLASAIRSERSDAAQGEIFSVPVEAAFRQMLADSIGERDGATFLAEFTHGEAIPRGIHPTVNEPYSMTQVFRVPLEVRLGLPELPPELDYRIAAHDLLLWDIGAGIVVDFLPDAFVTQVLTEE